MNVFRPSTCRAIGAITYLLDRAGARFSIALRGRRLKGKGKAVLGKGVLGARETRGRREGNACQETIVFKKGRERQFWEREF